MTIFFRQPAKTYIRKGKYVSPKIIRKTMVTTTKVPKMPRK